MGMSFQNGLSKSRMLIVQPYVPAYRVPLFREMKLRLEAEGIEMKLAVAGAQRGDSERADDRSGETTDYLVRSNTRRLGSRVFLNRDLENPLTNFLPGLVIVEQAIKNLESWPLLITSVKGGHPCVTTWGQRWSYSTSKSTLDASNKQGLPRRTD